MHAHTYTHVTAQNNVCNWGLEKTAVQSLSFKGPKWVPSPARSSPKPTSRDTFRFGPKQK